ncbi:OmpA family protein [Stenotrophomonas sp. LGBM10]|uniref:OmpA family protein n=1 Tax=Stenotrophomonas sp. LGBM10 TaxID=3390038 RepID=UPI00398A645E
MSSLDRLIEDAASRLGLGYRARSVVSVLTAYIATRDGGLPGLGDQFERAGLGALFHAWCRGEERPIVASEVERALGRDDLARLARRAGFPPGMFGVIVAELLPPLVDLLTTAEGAPVGLRTRRAASVPCGTAGQAVRGIALRSTLACLVGLCLIAATSWLYLITRAPPAPVSAVPAPSLDARVSLVVDGDHITVEGRVPAESDRRRILTALVRLYGADNVRGTLVVDRQVRAPRWEDRLLAHLPQLLAPGLRIALDGERIHVDSRALLHEDRLGVTRVLRDHFAAFDIRGLWTPGIAALHQLPPTAPPQALVAALNQTVVKFQPGATALTGDSRDTLQATAAAIRRLPDGTRLEVGVHTDSHGNAAAKRALSQLRAQSLVNALQELDVPADRLVAVGHGPDHPVADNRSESGRTLNRRVVYTVLR